MSTLVVYTQDKLDIVNEEMESLRRDMETLKRKQTEILELKKKCNEKIHFRGLIADWTQWKKEFVTLKTGPLKSSKRELPWWLSG